MWRPVRLTTAGRDLLSAELAIVAAQVSVWLRRTGDLVGCASPRPPLHHGEVGTRVRGLVKALDRAARYGPVRPSCLVRAIALARLLEARGHPGAQVRVGVLRQGERMAAHAWVEYRGCIVGDHERHVSQYDELSDVEVSL